MKFVRRELSVREDRLFHSIRASFAGIIPCKKKKYHCLRQMMVFFIIPITVFSLNNTEI